MSRYGGQSRGGGDRWDAERFEIEERSRRFEEREPARFEERERDTRFSSRSGGGFNAFPPRRRQHSDEDFDRRGPPSRFDDRGPPARFEEDRYEKKAYHDEEPRYERERERGGERTNITIEKEREYYSPSPPRRGPARPSFMRRQSSLDTFDRKPLTRFQGREEYGPPARYREEPRLPALTPIPLPRTRQLGPPPKSRYEERDYEEIRVAEPDFYGDDEYRGYPERVREREIVRTKRSRSKERRRSRSRSHSRESVKSRATRTVRSSSSSSAETTVSRATTAARNEFPKKGKTRMPARLVSKRVISDLGYQFEEEGDVIVIQKALGRENIDEVIKLSEDYKKSENPPITETEVTTYLVDADVQPPPQPVHFEHHHHAPSHAPRTVYEERRTEEVFTIPPPPQKYYTPPPPPPATYENVTDTKIMTRSVSPPRHHHHHHDAVIIDSPGPREHGALVVASHGPRDERSIRDEIRALEVEKEALRAEKRAEKEFRKADRIRRGGRHSEGDLVLYEERDEYMSGPVTVIKNEYVEESGGVKILKDKKGRMAISVPKYIR
ncbi:hypothetical protein BJ878DRAFT_286508 [Calycina marina]|uniref:DUF8035 domain-containing protein n=1 Tax=Calycina marina TaxID=1763456 RepID=A0A9P7ZC80_9HELO|nr:hypothetical protein BJ878DRAFT_286508 [Calycina marina]